MCESVAGLDIDLAWDVDLVVQVAPDARAIIIVRVGIENTSTAAIRHPAIAPENMIVRERLSGGTCPVRSAPEANDFVVTWRQIMSVDHARNISWAEKPVCKGVPHAHHSRVCQESPAKVSARRRRDAIADVEDAIPV